MPGDGFLSVGAQMDARNGWYSGLVVTISSIVELL